ncbi:MULTISPECIES: CaiB/BaiF CoA transferase family protein [Thermomonosporaceae]|uniref:CaiB/BaiF CoA transferase family protein n=1 Tax=Thermomonosporaceae TaxID=2012 RepID=UPI00255AA2B0|nr:MULTISPECIES: CoA transferase [Thermomonosporaceae]MDL4773898.1 CoA transferase [Actinomadura xylanilytica]
METHTRPDAPLAGVRIVEASMLGPGAVTTHLADLGADVIKVEPPRGDYLRETTWPLVAGVSLMHLHISRGKRSVVLDLRTAEGREVFLDLARGADVVVEAMRPGGLERRGVGPEVLSKVNPRVVFCGISGYGETGPYRTLPAHGVAFDTWAGLVRPEPAGDGHWAIPEHPSTGINAGPLFAALGILAAVIRARATGAGGRLEVAQSDAAASMDWLRSETWRAYERPESEVTGNRTDGYRRREPGTAGMRDGVRYQFYATADGHILLMASERELWRNFCVAVGRPDLFDRHPGSRYADHAVGDTVLRAALTEIFAGRGSAEWLAFGVEHNVPIGPVNTPRTLAADPQFQDRLPWLPAERLGTDQLPSPIRFVGEETRVPGRAPELGEHTGEILREVLGYDPPTIARLRESGALGAPGGPKTPGGPDAPGGAPGGSGTPGG